MEEKLKNLWWLIINKKYPINYEIYKIGNNFYFKVLIYKKQKSIELVIDLNDNEPIENLKKDKNYLKIQEEFKSWGNSKIVLNTIIDFNSIIEYIINNF